MRAFEPHTISVIIIANKSRDLLCRAIDSVLDQTRPPDEILVVDDGTLFRVRDMLSRIYPNVRYISQESGGKSHGFNLGVRQSYGSWIAFLEGENEWCLDKLEKQEKVLAKNKAYSFCYTNEIWVRDEKRIKTRNMPKKYGGNIFEHCLYSNMISLSSAMIHREIFEQLGYFDTSLNACEDYDLWLRVSAFLPVLYIKTPLMIKYLEKDEQKKESIHWEKERARIYAIEKLLANEELEDSKQILASEIILRRIEMFLREARKLYNLKDVALFESKQRRYRLLLEELLEYKNRRAVI